MVDESIDDASVMVKQVSVESHLMEESGRGPPVGGHQMEESGWGPPDEEAVTGGQLTKDIVITHNELFPKQKLSLEDLRPSLDPDHVCRGTVPLKNGILTCGCPIRAEAPEPITHRNVANFENLSIEALKIKNH